MATQPEAIYGKLVKIMEGIGPIAKDQKTKGLPFSYRGIEQFMNRLHPLLVEHRVIVVPRVVDHRQVDRETTDHNGTVKAQIHTLLRCEYDFIADDGSKVTASTQGESLSYSDKGTNACMSIALKYALAQIFCVPTGDIEEQERTNDDAGQQRGTPTQRKPVTGTERGSQGDDDWRKDTIFEVRRQAKALGLTWEDIDDYLHATGKISGNGKDNKPKTIWNLSNEQLEYARDYTAEFLGFVNDWKSDVIVGDDEPTSDDATQRPATNKHGGNDDLRF